MIVLYSCIFTRVFSKPQVNIKKYYEKNREEILKKQRDNRLFKKINKFPAIETVVKDEDIPVELL